MGNIETFNSIPEAQTKLDAGYSEPSPQEIQAHAKSIQYGGVGNELLTGAEAAGSAATFGLSRALLKEYGGKHFTSEEQANRAEENPISKGVGTVAGFAAPLVLGNLAAGAEAGSALAGTEAINPIAALSKLGRVAQEGTASALGGGNAAAQIAKAAISHGVGSAVEGAAYGLGQSVDESVLGDSKLVASNVMAHMGVSALLAGGLGAVIGGVGKSLPSSKFVPTEDQPIKNLFRPDAPLFGENAPSVDPAAGGKLQKIKQYMTDAYEKTIKEPALKMGDAIGGELGGKVVKQALKAGEYAMGAKLSPLIALEKAAQKVAPIIESGSKAIFRAVEPNEGAILGKIASTISGSAEDQTENRLDRQKDFNEKVDEIGSLASNPQQMADKLNEATQPIFQHAPQVTAALQGGLVQAVNFLNGKIPRPISQLPLSRPFIPTQTAIQQFNDYYDATNNPLGTLKHIKNGTLMPQHLEALTQVHPELYKQIQSQLMNQLTMQKKEIPYKIKMMLGMFMGQDLDESTEQQAIAINQQTLQGGVQAPAASGPQRRSNARSMDKLTLSSRSMTPMQKSAMRGEKS